MTSPNWPPTWASTSSASPARTGARPSPTPSPPSTGPGCGNWCSRKRSCQDCQPARDCPAANTTRRSPPTTSAPLALQLLQPAEPARAAAGRAGTAVLDMVRQTPDVGPQRAGRGGHRRNRALGRAAGRHQGHLGDVPRPPDRRRTEPPHYADPISCPVLAVGAQAYLGDEVARQLAHVAATSAAPSSRGRSQHRAGEPGRPGPGLPRLLRRRLTRGFSHADRSGIQIIHSARHWAAS